MTDRTEGMSFLFKINDYKYLFVGECVYEFKTKDVIIDYYTNSSEKIAYQMAHGENNIYYVSDQKHIRSDTYSESDN